LKYLDNRRPEATTKHLVKRLEQIGYDVTIQQPMRTDGNVVELNDEAIPAVKDKTIGHNLLHNSHDLRLPDWGPYTKKYHGISHIPDPNWAFVLT